jgi:hypothetical protein
MSLAAIAAFADVLTAIAVATSLIFVAFQIRQNTQEIKNTHYQASQSRSASLHSRTMDIKTAEIIVKGKKSYASLSDAEKLVFSSWIFEFNMVSTNFLMLSRQGVLRPELNEMYGNRLENLLKNPGVQEFFQDKDRPRVTASSEERVGRILATISSPHVAEQSESSAS